MNRFLLYLLTFTLLAALAPVTRGVILGDEDGLLLGESDDEEATITDQPLVVPGQSPERLVPVESATPDHVVPSTAAARLPAVLSPDETTDPASSPEAPPEKTMIEQLLVARPFAPGDPRETARQFRKLGDSLVASNRLDEASRAYWQASRLNPVNIGYLHYFGFTLLALGDHENGFEVYREILDRYPEARKAVFNLASAYYGLKQYDQALAAMDRYFVLSRREGPKAYFNMGLFLMAAGRNADALPWLEKIHPELPDNPFIPAMLIRLHRAAGRNDEADHLTAVNEDRFGAEPFQRLLAAEVLPAYLER